MKIAFALKHNPRVFTSLLVLALRGSCSNGEIERSRCSRLEIKRKELCFLKDFNLGLKPKFNNKIKELRLSQFLHYCS